MDWMQVSIALLSVSCLSRGQVGLLDGCPEGQEDGDKCQQLMSKVVGPMLVMKKPLSEKEKVKLCCNVAHAIHCLVTQAIPKCPTSHKEELMEQTQRFLPDAVFFHNRVLNTSCAEFEFRGHELPVACEGHVDGYPVRPDFFSVILLIACPAALSVSLTLLLVTRVTAYKLVVPEADAVAHDSERSVV